MTTEPSLTRDLRLDLFRGLALVCIFIDHVPGDRVSAFTIRNLGFADASEVFVFISAYTAGLVYGMQEARHGLAFAARRMWRRAGVVYVAHVLLVLASTVLAARLSTVLADPQFIQGLNVQPMLAAPVATFARTLLLAFQPTFNNILPLYVVLLLMGPAMLWAARRDAVLGVVASAGLWVLVRTRLDGVMSAAVGTRWEFDPLAWQLLFAIGVALGAARTGAGLRVRRSLGLTVLAVLYVAFAFLVQRVGWTLDGAAAMAPGWLQQLAFPAFERQGLSPWRLLHVLAMAYLVAGLLPTESRQVGSWLARPLIACGQHSLPIFAGGVLLSILGWAAIASIGEGLFAQVLVNVGGVGAMTGIAWVLTRWRRALRTW